MTFSLLSALALASFAQPPNGPDPNKATLWVNIPKPNSLPPRVSHHTYFSESMKREVGYLIYLPAAYEAEPGFGVRRPGEQGQQQAAAFQHAPV